MTIVDKNVGNNHIHNCGNFDETKRDPTNILPNELFLKVFPNFNLTTLGTLCCVSKEWKRLASDPILWKIAIYREIAFGNDKWTQCFGTNVVKDEDSKEEFSSLPWSDFIADCKKFKSIFPGKNVKDNLMLVRLPKTLNGQLTLKNLDVLAKKYLSKGLLPVIADELEDKSIDKSYWVIMTKDVLPGSRDKSYAEQQKIVAKLAENSLISYEVPETLESVACILSQYFFDSKTRLFSTDPLTSTRCKEIVGEDQQIIVGIFDRFGLKIILRNSDLDFNFIGIAALRKF